MICLVSDRHRCHAPRAAGPGTHLRSEDSLVAAITAAAHAGVDLVQVRERDLEGRALRALVERCVAAVQGTRARVVVNERFDVALAAGAHGVHLRADSMPASRVRAHAPAGFLIGRSVHGPDEIARAEGGAGLDYLVFGTVFETASKPGRAAAGLARLREIVNATPVPVLAVGGITVARMPAIAETGAAGVAAIGMFTRADPAALAAAVTRARAVFGATPR